jgi:hypothetical protein
MAGMVFDGARVGDLAQVAIVGAGQLQMVDAKPLGEPADPELDDRQVRALGKLGNARLRRLRVGLVGVGGTGSPLADELVRMGVSELFIVDPDRIDTTSNVRRIVGANIEDVSIHERKVDAVARHLRGTGLSVDLDVSGGDVRTEAVARRLLDMDVVISTTDTHSSRSVLNQLAYQYFLPLIDVGVKVGTSRSGDVTGMPTEVRVLLPDGACLWCSGVLDAARIRAENLPAQERQQQQREGYIQGINEPQPSLAALNAFAASLATLTMLRLLGPGTLGSRTIADGWEHYFADATPEIDPDCICHAWRGRGDEVSIGFLPD